MDEERDGAAQGFRVEEGGQRRDEARAEGVEDGDAVVDDGIDVGDVGAEAVGEPVALVIDGADGEATVLGEEDGGEEHEPAGLSCETVHDAEHADGVAPKGSPRLVEDILPAGILVSGARVGDAVLRVELVRG